MATGNNMPPRRNGNKQNRNAMLPIQGMYASSNENRNNYPANRSTTGKASVSYASAGNETVRFTAVAKRPSKEESALIKRRYENSALANKKLTARRKPVMHTIASQEVKPFPWSIMFISVIGTLLFMLMIYNNVQINEKTAQLEVLESESVTLEKGLKDLELELERKNDLRAIEKRALELGMVKQDELSKQYISISPEDKMEIVDEEKEGKRFRFTGIFETVYQKISEFFEFIR